MPASRETSAEHPTRSNPEREPKALRKLERMNKALKHEEGDRVPISDFFWGSFLTRWREALGLSEEMTPYTYYDLDWIVTMPNMDPHIHPFEILRENDQEVWVKTGFETVLRKRFDLPMPEQMSWDTNTIEALENFQFDAPDDPRRFFQGGDNQIAGVGDGFARNSPPWLESVQSLRPQFPVYGSMIETAECLIRLIGQANFLLWIGLYPDRLGRVIDRIGEFYLHCTKAALDAADGMLDGFVIWGDIAYRGGLFFSPNYWRKHFKPWVKAMVEACHDKELPVIYHGCGDVRLLFQDFIEVGIDAYNPLEAKAGMDVLELRREIGHQIAFCGNSNIQIWEQGHEDKIRAEVLRKLNAAKGGGLIFQSDHSVTSGVSGEVYDGIVKLVMERGTYPLSLGEYDEEV